MGVSNANNGPSDEPDREAQLALFADVSAVPVPAVGVDSEARRNGSSDGELEARGFVTGAGGALPHADADRAELSVLEEMLVAARMAGDERAPLEILASSLADAAVPPRRRPTDEISVRRARDDWLRRLEASRKTRARWWRTASRSTTYSTGRSRGIAACSRKRRSSTTSALTSSARTRRRRPTTAASCFSGDSLAGSVDAVARPTRFATSTRRRSHVRSATG